MTQMAERVVTDLARPTKALFLRPHIGLCAQDYSGCRGWPFILRKVAAARRHRADKCNPMDRRICRIASMQQCCTAPSRAGRLGSPNLVRSDWASVDRIRTRGAGPYTADMCSQTRGTTGMRWNRLGSRRTLGLFGPRIPRPLGRPSQYHRRTAQVLAANLSPRPKEALRDRSRAWPW